MRVSFYVFTQLQITRIVSIHRLSPPEPRVGGYGYDFLEFRGFRGVRISTVKSIENVRRILPTPWYIELKILKVPHGKRLQNIGAGKKSIGPSRGREAHNTS